MKQSDAHWKNPDWHYVNSSETAKPNYLLERFKALGFVPPSESKKDERKAA
jgi:hypothetical protein